MDIIILIFCETGFGDQYSSLITGLNCLIDLRNMGVEPRVVISKGHKYFPNEISLSNIYNLNSFNCEIIEVHFTEVEKLTYGYELLLFTSIQVWVKKKTELLVKYGSEHKHISRYNMNLISTEPILDLTLIKNDILLQSDKIVNNKKNIIGIHFRGGDDTIYCGIDEIINHPYWGNEIKRVYKIIESHLENDIMVGSINRRVCEHLSKKYKNVFFNEFKNKDLPMHNIIGHYEKINNEDVYIEHAKNIISEMASFSRCLNIWSFNTFPSNFILYGIINNVHYSQWKDKIKISVI